MGFTIKSEKSPYPFSIGAEAKPAFTVVAGQAAHTLNPGAFVSEKAPSYSISTGKPYQYSLTTGKPYQYSIKSGKELVGAVAPVAPLIEEELPAAPVNDTNVTNQTGTVTPEGLETTESAEVTETVEAETAEVTTEEPVVDETAEAEVNVTETVEAPVVEAAPMTYAVSGMVYEDLNANATKDADEMGLANITVNLAGAELMEAVTAEDGSYVFEGILAGDYMVSVAAVPGWNVPAGVSITVADNVTAVDFALTQMVEEVVEEPPVEVPPVNETADA
ncbi:MAG: hypothetical protein GKC10_05145 [Methanosarcinales archaeon]|nr:hypothetical protein [Methanosarcinales archaeon]